MKINQSLLIVFIVGLVAVVGVVALIYNNYSYMYSVNNYVPSSSGKVGTAALPLATSASKKDGCALTANGATGYIYIEDTKEYVSIENVCDIDNPTILYQYSCDKIDGENIVVSSATECPNGCSQGYCV